MNDFLRAIRIFNLVFLLVLSLPVMAELPPQTRWADPSSVRLDVDFPGNDYHAKWVMFRCPCGDLLIRWELNVPGETQKGETLLVNGRVVLSRGFGEHLEELGSSLDAPALMMQTALLLLERAVPKGPAAITEKTEVVIADGINPIHVDSGTAAGTYMAPWSMRGTIRPTSETRRKFDLDFTFSNGNREEELAGNMRLSGLAEYGDGKFPQAPSTPLEGWQLFWIDDADPAAEGAADLATLAELRSWIDKN
ncbi:MAG: hypothetical protein IID60_10240 [Proteobacteria bacterium]|nr:hypothetical protein [Pseudomonadota bacterium]